MVKVPSQNAPLDALPVNYRKMFIRRFYKQKCHSIFYEWIIYLGLFERGASNIIINQQIINWIKARKVRRPQKYHLTQENMHEILATFSKSAGFTNF